MTVDYSSCSSYKYSSDIKWTKLYLCVGATGKENTNTT